MIGHNVAVLLFAACALCQRKSLLCHSLSSFCSWKHLQRQRGRGWCSVLPRRSRGFYRCAGGGRGEGGGRRSGGRSDNGGDLLRLVDHALTFELLHLEGWRRRQWKQASVCWGDGGDGAGVPLSVGSSQQPNLWQETQIIFIELTHF